MSDPYVGEIRMFAGSFAPAGWAFCDGTMLPISENEVLFQLIGTTYGGDGEETFSLPDMKGRIPAHVGNNFVLGEKFGSEEVTLTTQQIPVHSHAIVASGTIATEANPSNNVLSTLTSGDAYMVEFLPANTPLAPASISVVGGSQPHENMMPYLTVSFIISLFGISPRFS